MDEEMFTRSLEDILEWYDDAGFPQFRANLREGASAELVAQVEHDLGFDLPTPLASLYARYDGQREIESFPLFEWLAFWPIMRAGTLVHDSLMARYFGVKRGERAVDVGYVSAYVFGEDVLLDEEYDTRWFPFANTEGDFLAAHAQTGRVIRALKGDAPVGRVVADSVDAFLYQFANELWDDLYTMMGDLEVAGVEEEGLVYLKAYAGRG